MRLLLGRFAPTRSQQRAFKQHLALSVRILPLGFHEKHYTLYAQYQSIRHAEEGTQNGVLNDDVEQYRQFLCHSNVDSLMIEFSDAQGDIKIVSVVDVVQDGISAVYTFYDATERKNSYGTYSIVWLSQWTQTLNLPYLYLGYWIQDSPKMAYKQLFKPLEKLIDGEWIEG